MGKESGTSEYLPWEHCQQHQMRANKKTQTMDWILSEVCANGMHIRSVRPIKHLLEMTNKSRNRLDPELSTVRARMFALVRLYFTLSFECEQRYFDSHSKLKEYVDCSVLYYRMNGQKLPIPCEFTFRL